MKVKVCGLKYAKNIAEVAELNPDFVGFIFYEKSLRFAGDKLNPEQITTLPQKIVKTGVFVDEDSQTIQNICRDFKLNAVQLHGSENAALCEELQNLGLKVIKSFGIFEDFDFNELTPFVHSCDYFLFDTQTKNHGGSGKKFSWDILKNYQYHIPYFLSGGISIDDLNKIKEIKDNMLYAIDINSRFELAPGLKDISVLKVLINRIKHEF